MLEAELADQLTALLGNAISRWSRKTYQRAWKTYHEFSVQFSQSLSPPMLCYSLLI